MSLKKFHFTIGPVQGFVTQSRRIRDLLASSFLLSFLSGQAMVEVDRQGGRLLFPEIGNQEKGFRDPLFRAIQAERAGEEWVPALGWVFPTGLRRRCGKNSPRFLCESR